MAKNSVESYILPSDGRGKLQRGVNRAARQRRSKVLEAMFRDFGEDDYHCNATSVLNDILVFFSAIYRFLECRSSFTM